MTINTKSTILIQDRKTNAVIKLKQNNFSHEEITLKTSRSKAILLEHKLKLTAGN